ncbi:YbbR-like domain-containing protein [Rossellomorea sp. FS2]|uniref:CdaR family protein n=1 Tax=Rossellomorea sp. FS2 TaxID=3391447 RepID=UPI003A4DA55A
MDKFMESRWFMRIVGLLLALILYMSVNFGDLQKEANRPSSGSSQEDVETVQDVPLEVFYDSDNLVVTGMPETVNVRLEGPKALVQAAKQVKDFQVYVDLNDVGIGNHQVEVKIDNLSDKMKAKVNPGYVNVSVQEKVTKEFGVEPEFNEGLLADGYDAQGLAVEPKTVKVTGAKDEVERITYVKATIDVDNEINQNVTREAQVQVLDRNYNKLDVEVEPETVDVTVSVTNPSKTVPISVKEKGELPEGVTLNSISVKPKEATIFGNQSLLDTVKELFAEVDLSDIKKDTTKKVKIGPQSDLNKVTPEEVEITIDVSQVSTDENKELTGVPITPEGLPEDYEYTVTSPEAEAVDVSLSGPQDEVSKVTKDDFSLALDLSGLEPGEHEVEITAQGPDNVDWTLSQKTVTVEIKDKNTSADG